MKLVQHLVIFFLLVSFIEGNQFTINILHINDLHARFEETNNEGGECKTNECIGGYSRLYKQIQTAFAANPDAILLNAGDNYQGTLWYNLFKWNVTQYFMNKLPWDAFVLGNHEFDDGIKGIVPYIKALKAPTVVANMNDTFEPTIQEIYQKSVVIERFGKRIGIIGVILKKTNEISNTEKLIFLDESESVNEEAERLVKEENVVTNIVLSHCGFGVDLEIAKKATAPSKISVIVGGHTNTFLYTGSPVPGPLKPQGVYPTVINRTEDNQPVLVVQASCYNRFLGNLTVTYDENGNITSFHGNPIFLAADLPEDDEITRELAPWKVQVHERGEKILGRALVTLDRSVCKQAECLLGNFVADAMVHSFMTEADLNASLAVVNPGALRTAIASGMVTYSDMTIANPFENTIDVGEILGHDLKDLFEFSMSPYSGRQPYDVNLLQVSGFKLVFNLSNPIGHRVQSIKVRCADCPIPVYEKLQLNQTYRLIVSSYLRSGGDGFRLIQDKLRNVRVGKIDIEVLVEYFEKRRHIFQEIEGRFYIVGSTKGIRFRDIYPDYCISDRFR